MTDHDDFSLTNPNEIFKDLSKLKIEEKTKQDKTSGCLPSFLLGDDIDDIQEVEEGDKDSRKSSEPEESDDDNPKAQKQVKKPKRILSRPMQHKFFSVDDIKSMGMFHQFPNQPKPQGVNINQSPNINNINQSPLLHPPTRMQQSQQFPSINNIKNIGGMNMNTPFNYGSVTQNNIYNYNLQMNYSQQPQLQPQLQQPQMHPQNYIYPTSFTYNPVGLMMQQQQMQAGVQPGMAQRMNSFEGILPTESPILSSTMNSGAKSTKNQGGMNVITFPTTTRHNSQNGGLSNSHSKSPPSPKKSGTNAKQKKGPKKSTADSDSISVASLLSLSNNDLYSYIITQKGSREVQSVLKKVTESDVDTLISRLSSHFSDIMIDKYGNYFSQRLIQICSPQQRVALLKSIENRFVEISINSFGTHPLQSLIEIVNMPNEREILLRCIEGHEVELSLDSKGTHVIQKFISCSSEEERGNVDKNILKHLSKFINDSFGVCVLIKLIKHTTDGNVKEVIAKFISDNNALSFIQNPYANYVVQSLFNQNDIYLCSDIIKTIVDHFFSLSMQKFSSNVVENCIRFSNFEVVQKIYKDIMSTGKLGSMLNNTYGNFVIEKLVARLTKEEKQEMIKEITKLGKEKNLSNTIMNLLYK